MSGSKKRYVLNYLAKSSKEKTARRALETPSCGSEYIKLSKQEREWGIY